MDSERIKGDQFAPLPVGPPFQAFSGGFTSPFRETNTLARVDYQFAHGANLFYRNSYYQSSLFATRGQGFQVYDTKNITRAHVLGADFNTGTFTHAIRLEYLKFANQVVDKTMGSSLPLADLGLTLFMNGPGLATGANFLAPQTTLQSNHQIKYDGSKTAHSHILRYGVSLNHIQGFTYEALLSLQPLDFTNAGPVEELFAASSCGAGTPCFTGGISNPLNYPVEGVLVGNGLGYYSEPSSFGYPAGGLGPDNRLGVYIGDSWKIKPNLTLTYGLRYVRDTGRTDSDVPALPQLNALVPGLGNSVRQPNANFAPQAGFAWDPSGHGRTSIRGGIRLFFENSIWNNIFFDRPLRLPRGAFNAFPSRLCWPGSGTSGAGVRYGDHPRSWSVRNCWRRTHRDRLGGRQYYVLSEPVPIAFDCRFERPESAVCGQRAFSGAQPLRRFTWTQLSDAALYSDEHRNTARSPARSGTERRLPSQREPTLSPGRGAEPCWRCPLL